MYAVERTSIASVARELARANGFADRIEVIESDVRSVQLPRPVDVVVSELLSRAFLGQSFEALTRFCRDRFLAPGGRILPERVDFLVAPVSAPETYGSIEYPAPDVHGLDFAKLAELSVNEVSGARLPANAALAPARVAQHFDARTTDGRDRVDANLVFDVAKGGTLHGIGGWFVATLAEGITIDTSPPGIPSWDNVFYPLARPVEVSPGMRVELSLAGLDVDATVTWSWSVVVKASATSGEVVARANQSTFLGAAPSPRALARRSGDFRPEVALSGSILAAVLAECDGRRTSKEIAQRLVERGLLAPEDAERTVRDLIARLDDERHLKR